MECPFCKIVSGEIAAYKIYEDDFSLAFLDRHPAIEGHILIIPKQHFDRFTDMTPHQAGLLFASANRITKTIEKTLEVPGSNIAINNGKVAGQVVPHVHIHLMPRKEDDGAGHGIRAIFRSSPGKIDLEELAERIRKSF